MKKPFLFSFITLCLCFSLSAFGLGIYGHRGARGLSPENTIPAYQTALAVGVDYVDMDINMTKDGVLVVTHNFALNPIITRDAKGHWISTKMKVFVKDLTLAQLQQYDVGRIKPGTLYSRLFASQYPVDHTHIPTLKQVIDYVKSVAGDRVGFQIEIKTDPTHPEWSFSPKKLATALAKLMQQEGIVNRTEVQAYDWRCLLAIQKINPKIVTAYLTDELIVKSMSSSDPKVAGLWSAGYLLKNYRSVPDMIAALGGKIWGPEYWGVTLKLVNEAHHDQLKVVGFKLVPYTWPEKYGTEFNPKLIEKLIDMGVDGIITDRPDMLRGLMAARGMKVPPSFGLVSQRNVREN